MPTDKPEQELIKVADLIVGLRNTLTERQRDLDLASKAIKDRDATLAEKNEQIGNLTAELEAMRQGVDAYRLASSKDSAPVRQWEDAVGSLIWPIKLSTVVCHPQQPWHLGELPLDLTSVPGIEWETEIKSGDIRTTTGFFKGEPTTRHRPTNLTWEAVYKLAARYHGKAHCISGHPRLEDSQIAAWFWPGKEGPEIVAARIVSRLVDASYTGATRAWQEAGETGAMGYYRGLRAAFGEIKAELDRLIAAASKADGT